MRKAPAVAAAAALAGAGCSWFGDGTTTDRKKPTPVIGLP